MEPVLGKSNSYGFSYLPILGDYLLRWVILAIWRFGVISDVLFWIGQLVLTPIVLLILTFIRADRISKKLGIKDTVTSELAGWSFLFYVFIILSGSYISSSLYPNWQVWIRIVLAFVVFLVYGIYVFVLFIYSPKAVRKMRAEKAIEERPLRLYADENDVEIIGIRTELHSVSQRVDAYTLESTLFGALAFSAFIAIVVSDKPLLAGIQDILLILQNIAYAIIHLNFSASNFILFINYDNTPIIAAIAIETLTCSMFFLSAIVSRLRVSEVLKDLDRFIMLAQAYNEKEEEMLTLGLEGGNSTVEQQVKNRMQLMNQRVSQSVDNARELLHELSPLVGYMRVSRDLGVGNFLLILITSAFLLMHELAIFFLILSFLAYTYTSIDRWARSKRLQSILQRMERVFYTQSTPTKEDESKSKPKAA